MPSERQRRIEFEGEEEDHGPLSEGHHDLQQQKKRHRVRTVSFAEKCDEQGETRVICYRKFVGDRMDRFLANIGLSQRAIVQDNGQSFYRAICEEIYLVQTPGMLEEVRQLIDVSMEFDNTKTDAQAGGALSQSKQDERIRTTARIFEATIQVFRRPGTPPEYYHPPEGISPIREILLTETSPDHFHRVIKKQAAHVAGHAQAILYRSMYEKVFDLRSDLIDEGIRRTRETAETWGWANNARREKYFPPIPFCMLKAMDPCIYRNVSYDSLKKSQKKKRQSDFPKQLEFPLGSLCAFYSCGTTKYGMVAAIYSAIKRVLKLDNGALEIAHIKDLYSMEPSDSSSRATGAIAHFPNGRVLVCNYPRDPYANSYHLYTAYPSNGYGMQYPMNPPVGPPPPYYPSAPVPMVLSGNQYPMPNPMDPPPSYYAGSPPQMPMGGFPGNGNQYTFYSGHPAFPSPGGPITYQQTPIYGRYNTPNGTVVVPAQPMTIYKPAPGFAPNGHQLPPSGDRSSSAGAASDGSRR